MENFTEGEWEYEQYAFGDKRVLSEGAVVAIIACTDVGDEQCDANAALIVAAPEMYDDIKLDIDWLKRLRSLFVFGSDGFRSCSLRIESKEKLLAKARGGK